MHRTKVSALAALASALAGAAHAQSLKVSPVTIELPPAATNSLLNVASDSEKPITVQARVFRWIQVNGEDRLERTAGLAVSPPQLRVARDAGGIVRIVRLSKEPVAGEECYRVFLDEIPDRSRIQAGTITLAMRHSIPVCFNGMDAVRGELRWSVSSSGGKLSLQAANTGQKRIKLSGLRVTDSEARRLISMDGLAGYVLGGKIKIWDLTVPKGALRQGTTITIQARSETGPINASASVGNGG